MFTATTIVLEGSRRRSELITVSSLYLVGESGSFEGALSEGMIENQLFRNQQSSHNMCKGIRYFEIGHIFVNW
jgi:hypothetical protein